MNLLIQLTILRIERIGPARIPTLEKSIDTLLELAKTAEPEDRKTILTLADHYAGKLKRIRGW